MRLYVISILMISVTIRLLLLCDAVGQLSWFFVLLYIRQNDMSVAYVGLDRNSRIYSKRYTRSQGFCRTFFIKPSLSVVYGPRYQDLCIQESDMPFGNKRRFLNIIVRNSGLTIAENCEASLTLEKTTNKDRPPSKEPKRLLWDNNQEYRTIGKRNGDAILHIVFSDSSFTLPQLDNTNTLAEGRKTYAMVSTVRSFGNLNPNTIPFVQDGIGIGDSYFTLVIKTIRGVYIEERLKIHVSNNWHDLSLEDTRFEKYRSQ